MDYLSWDLAILSRAVSYNTLSSASAHVGLSQPQLSRIVAKLEEQLDVTLLDRENRRKTSWTPTAHKLSEIYTKTFQAFRSEVHDLASGDGLDRLHMGSLEGLVPLAHELVKGLLAKTGTKCIEMEVGDTHLLQEKFEKGEIDLLLTSAEATARTSPRRLLIGYQTIIETTNKGPTVLSLSEYGARKRPFVKNGDDDFGSKILVSNSLQVRKRWLTDFGGQGTLPSPVRRCRTGVANEVGVHLSCAR